MYLLQSGEPSHPAEWLAEQQETLQERVFTIKPMPRVERLREAMVNRKFAASIDRAHIETRVMKETEGQPIITRRAKVFAAVAREMPIDIHPDDLLVGCPSVRPGYANVSPAEGPAAEEGWFQVPYPSLEPIGVNLRVNS